MLIIPQNEINREKYFPYRFYISLQTSGVLICMVIPVHLLVNLKRIL